VFGYCSTTPLINKNPSQTVFVDSRSIGSVEAIIRIYFPGHEANHFSVGTVSKIAVQHDPGSIRTRDHVMRAPSHTVFLRHCDGLLSWETVRVTDS
jgi:hypothetical protein